MSSEQRGNSAPLVSNSSIFIISAFLVGLAVGNFTTPELSPYVLSCGLAGFVAFLGLEQAAVRRHLAQVESTQQMLEDRLQRHVVPRPSSSPLSDHPAE